MSEAIRAQFERCREWLFPALEIGAENTPEELLGELVSGRAQLWPGEASALVTQLIAGAKGRSIHAWLGGGKLSELIQLRPGVETWGRSMGAEWATIDGRKGWAKVFRRLGYAWDGEVLRKAL